MGNGEKMRWHCCDIQHRPSTRNTHSQPAMRSRKLSKFTNHHTLGDIPKLNTLSKLLFCQEILYCSLMTQLRWDKNPKSDFKLIDLDSVVINKKTKMAVSIGSTMSTVSTMSHFEYWGFAAYLRNDIKMAFSPDMQINTPHIQGTHPYAE